MRALVSLGLCLAWPCAAEEITIFSSSIGFIPPSDFHEGFQRAEGPSFLREYVTGTETVESWSQLVTLTGAQGARDAPAFAQQMAEGFNAVCPQSLTTLRLDDPIVPGTRAVFAAFLACGDNGEGHSEAMVLLAMAGPRDLYTLQWAELGPASSRPMAFDKALWYPRLAALAKGAQICPPHGDAAPGGCLY